MPLSSNQDLMRGGQIFGQNIGMTMQVISTILFWSMLAAIIAFIAIFAFRLYIAPGSFFWFQEWLLAKLDMLSSSIGSPFSGKGTTIVSNFHFTYNGHDYSLPVDHFLSMPLNGKVKTISHSEFDLELNHWLVWRSGNSRKHDLLF